MNVPNIFQSNSDVNYVFNSARASAINILSRFERSDSYIDKLLGYELETRGFNDYDKALLVEIVNGVIRWKGKLDYILIGFYHGDYLKCLNIVKNSLRVALYQILFLDKIPIHAAINESVEITKRVQGEKTANIVNGVLRNIGRNLTEIRYPDKAEDPIYYLSVMYSHPRWLVRRWFDRFGEAPTERLLFANNKKAHIPIRVNTLRSSVDEIEVILKEKNLNYYQSPYYRNSFVVKNIRADIRSYESFRDGKITIQDTSASLSATLAKPKEGNLVIDLCAAPGGKSFLLAEQMNNHGRVIACDKYKSKLYFIEDGAKRLGLTCIETKEADAMTIELDELADVVFADVPCSGLGTISKKPEIKWKREREDIYQLTEVQKQILEHASKLVKVGGAILYSTCTIEDEENKDIVNKFLEEHPNFELDPAEKYLPFEVCSDGFMQTYPHIHYIDGAFAARLVRKD